MKSFSQFLLHEAKTKIKNDATKFEGDLIAAMGASSPGSTNATWDPPDPNDPNVTPFDENSATNPYEVYSTNRDGLGPNQWTSGWYLGADPGNYNWDVAEPFADINRNGVFDEGVDLFDAEDDFDGDENWTGPALIEACEFRDGDYWMTPEMYVDYEDFLDLESHWNYVNQSLFLLKRNDDQIFY